MNWYLIAFKKYFDFKGRATRAEYWYFVLFYTLGTFFWAVIAGFFGMSSIKPIIMAILGLYMFIHIIPSLSLSVRRLHDINKSAWWLLVGFIPIVGGVILSYYIFYISIFFN